MKLLKSILLAILILGVASIIYGYYQFTQARDEAFSRLDSGSQLAASKIGMIEYVLKGDSGSIVLFLHGMPGGYDQAPENWPGFRLLAPSRPGYLRTSIELGRTPGQQSDVYSALLEELGIDRVIVLGVSGGGPSALEFAANYPEKTEALIMMEAISQRFPNEGEMSSLMTSDYLYWSMFTLMLQTQGVEGVANMQVSDTGQRDDILSDATKTERFVDTLWSVWPGSLRVEGWVNDMQQIGLLENAPSVRVPTLIIHGEADSTVPVGHSKTLATQIAGSELHVIPNATHLMPLTHDTEIRELILDFLSRNSE